MIQSATEVFAIRVSRANIDHHKKYTTFNRHRTPNNRQHPVAGDWIVRTVVQTFIVDDERVREFISTGHVDTLYSDTEFRRRFARTAQRTRRGTYYILAK